MIKLTKQDALSRTDTNNQQKIKLNQENFNTNREIVFLSKDDSFLLSKKGNGWSEFYSKFLKAKGIVSLFAIGFNKNNTQALACYESTTDYWAGAGYLIAYELDNDN